MGLIYTTIIHKFRKLNKLTCNEYVLADMIYKLSTSPLSKIRGWCYMSRQTMADELGLSKQSILNLIDGLIEKGFLKKEDKTANLKTTKKWDVVYFIDQCSKESLPINGKESLPHGSKESLPDNNTLDNTSLFDNKEDLFSKFIKEFNVITGKQCKQIDKVKKQFILRLKQYAFDEIIQAVKNATKDDFHIGNNFNDLTPEFITRPDKLERYINYKPKEPKKEIANNGFIISSNKIDHRK